MTLMTNLKLRLATMMKMQCIKQTQRNKVRENMKAVNLIFGIGLLILPLNVMAAKLCTTYDEQGIPIRHPDSTPCATAAFEAALENNKGSLDPNSYTNEYAIQIWLQESLFSKATLDAVTKCPEIETFNDDDIICFETISLPMALGPTDNPSDKFNLGMSKKQLLQRQELGNKHARLAKDGNPAIDENSSDIWTNTDPGWYAIMAVRPGALRDFVGPDKNNTVGIHYIQANIDRLFPSDCADDSALADDDNNFNEAVVETVNMAGAGEDDPNDYYVAGDVDLRWITYLEIAADVVLTVVTYGGWTAATGAIKGARATRAAKNLIKHINILRKSDKVKDYIKTTVRATELADQIKDMDKSIDALETTLKAATKADNISDAKVLKKVENLDNRIAKINKELRTTNQKSKRAKDLQAQRKRLEQEKRTIQNKSKNNLQTELDDLKAKRANASKELDDANTSIKNLEKADDVKKYKEADSAYHEVMAYRRNLRALRMPKTGNIFIRTYRAAKAAWGGGKTLNKAAKIGRASMKSGKIRDWLFHSTLENTSAITKLAAKGGIAYSAVKFIGDMWDYTDVSTGDYTNGVDFKPLLLVSADDLGGDQENVVNHGMWFMWVGDSIDAADDDAAYLQAMEFAAKLHETLDKNSKNGSKCPIDLYVVRPILRNPNTPNAAIYYLVMNDEPWSVE